MIYSFAGDDELIVSLRTIYSVLNPDELMPSHPAILESEIIRGIERLRKKRDTFATRLNRLDEKLMTPELRASEASEASEASQVDAAPLQVSEASDPSRYDELTISARFML